MVVEVAANPVPSDEVGQLSETGRLDFPRAFSQGGRDVLHSERLVYVGLGCRGDHSVAVEEPVLAQEPIPVDRSLPECDVVGLRPGEVQECRTDLGWVHGADVDLHSFPGEERRLGLAGAHDLADLRKCDHGLAHGTRLSRGDHYVDVSDRLREPANRATGHGLLHSFDAGHPLD